ncbi:MAG: ABC transporter substrate-binding protein, partial [Alphaproteobacteria bacterium]
MNKISAVRPFLIAIGAALLLAACGQSEQAQQDLSAQENITILNRGNTAEPRSLDPHYAQAQYESTIVGDLMMGLTIDGPDAISIPAAAENWDVSDDGLVWTFHLREHVWSDGIPVTAEDFVYAWQRILDPQTAAPYASLLYIFKNAQAVNSGAVPPSSLGASALDARTLVLELENPAPYLPELMSHFTTYPVPRHVVEVMGSDWTAAENYVGNGPFN